ncbi:tetratricopeptide repeat protein [Runella salmonicolor]|uniref:Tetratricopeptide repeat protein n=1 Tax=Runella salmonicolor TaxID=2950278 RepID=A0ABT1FKQ3_9BACT|nr:tetratricopeptide repeat protein [Runella salmonicolor]MCP1382329.1 tetratricopeptide repeat protein [Runella salmonicolor]
MSKAKKGTTPPPKPPHKQNIAGETPPSPSVFKPALDLPPVPQTPPLNDGLFRKIFWGIALALLIGMPLLSTQYGITADEWGNKAYGELCLDYFTSLGEKKEALSYAPRGGEVMYCYGPTLDLISAAIYRTTGADPYTIRHIMLSLMGVLIIVFSGLTGRLVGGNWRVGLIALLFALFSPRIFGDSMNNPKDITFAAGYIVTICFLIKFLQELPRPSWRSTLLLIVGIGIGLGSRAPGLALVGYVPFFVLMEVFIRNGLRKTIFNDKLLIRDVALKTTIATLGGYALGIAFWPFALANPLKNPLVALQTLTNFPISIKTLFDGTKIYSTSLPWYYVPKYMLVSTPLYFLLGLLIFVLIFPFVRKHFNRRYLLMVLFVALFPLIYGISKNSAFYNGWRHTTFIYPPLVVLSAVGVEYLLRRFAGIGQKVFLGIMAVLVALPLWFMVKNHPYQYTYYNEFTGGVKGAFGKYETDYFGSSTREIADWMKKNIPSIEKDSVIIASDYFVPLKDYFTDYPKLKMAYRRYYQRSEHDWDYAVFLTGHLTPSHFRNPNVFPPAGTIHKIEVNGAPIGIIVKRISKDDFIGINFIKQGKIEESIPYLERAKQLDPNNEVVKLYLANAYINVGRFNEALQECQKALEIFPDYLGAMTTMAIAYINVNQIENAIFMLSEVLSQDPTNRDAAQYLALAYERKGDMASANQIRAQLQQRK